MKNDKINLKKISVETIILGWMPIFNRLQGNMVASVELIDESEYEDLRSQVNSAFQIDVESKFVGNVQEDTEFGDVTDVVLIMLREKYPPEKYGATVSEVMLNVEQRKAWRNELIRELDEMVAR